MNKTLKDILDLSIYFLVVILISFLILKFVGQRSVVIGDSMNNTLFDGESLVLDKISYRFHEPERFDIVVFPFRDNSNKTYVKRIIALPGETIQITEDGNILIDNVLLEENYGLEVIKKRGSAAEPITLGKNEYFVMGDNRNNSDDSRFNVGVVYRNEIMGKIRFRIFPFSRFGKVR